MGALIQLVLVVVVAGLVWWLLNWLVDYVQVPEPFHKVAKVLLAVVAVLFVVYALLGLVGWGGGWPTPRVVPMP